MTASRPLIIGVLGLVSCSVICAVVLWYPSAELSPRTPLAAIEVLVNGDNVHFLVLTVETNVAWEEVRISVSDGIHVAAWSVHSSDFDDSQNATLETIALGSSILSCEICDRESDGRVSCGDEFTLSGSAGLYLTALVYIPTEGSMFSHSFHIAPATL